MPTGAMGWNKRVNRATLGEHGTRGHSRAEAYRPHIEQQRSTVQWAPASATSDSISCEGPSSPTTVSAASCTETSGPQPTAVLAWHTLPTVKRPGQAVITRSQTVNVGPWTQFSWGQIGSPPGFVALGRTIKGGQGGLDTDKLSSPDGQTQRQIKEFTLPEAGKLYVQPHTQSPEVLPVPHMTPTPGPSRDTRRHGPISYPHMYQCESTLEVNILCQSMQWHGFRPTKNQNNGNQK